MTFISEQNLQKYEERCTVCSPFETSGNTAYKNIILFNVWIWRIKLNLESNLAYSLQNAECRLLQIFSAFSDLV